MMEEVENFEKKRKMKVRKFLKNKSRASAVLLALWSAAAWGIEPAAPAQVRWKASARTAFCDILNKTQAGGKQPLPCEKVLNSSSISNEALSLLEGQEEVRHEGCAANIPGPDHMRDWLILDASEQFDNNAKKAIAEYCPRLNKIGSSKELAQSCSNFLRTLRNGQQNSGAEKKALLQQLSRNPSAQVLLAAYLRQSIVDRAQENCLVGFLGQKSGRVGEMQAKTRESPGEYNDVRGSKAIPEEAIPWDSESGRVRRSGADGAR
jgi:hypothetical protein